MRKILPGLFLVFVIILTFVGNADASYRKKVNSSRQVQVKRDLQIIQKKFYDTDNSKPFIKKLKAKVMDMGPTAVPVLTRVLKDKKVSDQKRWMATFSLARIMGKKSSDYLAKFTKHPNWMLRLASLKSLLSLSDKSKGEFYKDALKDKSLIVRSQALENIRSLKLEKYSGDVWKMLFHKHNYQGSKGERKRMPIISKVIRAVGDLKHKPAKKVLTKLINNEKYKDLAKDLDYSLRKITGEISPRTLKEQRSFWRKKMALK